MELTIDELAGRAQLPVRTLREYHSMRLLPPPERRGRIGVYGAQHVERLELIGRLQRRGYSLAGIRDLLAAWDAGADLTTLLGVDSGPAALDETPLRITGPELSERVPALTAGAIGQAVAAGLLVPLGEEDFLVRSPALLALVADGTQAGAPLTAMLDVIATLTGGLERLAGDLAGRIVEHIAPPLASSGDADQLQSLLRRWRVLLPQGVASILADRLGAALLAEEGGPAGEQLRAAIDRIRIGVTTDTAGTIRRYPA
ncbi:MAG TPA: MerR family transcriptional regulator [Streptosporangiaceae bacterium]|nr:MerR family transcriptional regulator [Streptosporangiaceae bacterium]